jgi:hypothetical protein
MHSLPGNLCYASSVNYLFPMQSFYCNYLRGERKRERERKKRENKKERKRESERERARERDREGASE